MPSLRDLQTQMLDALLAASPEGAVPLIAAPADQALPRLRVYQNNVQSNFEDALRSSFPAVERLVGAEYFRQTAHRFQRHHPSPSGDLLHAGSLFPGYLAHLHADDDFSYLGDVARLEWLIQETLLSTDHAPLNLPALSRVAPGAYDALRLELHPALRLFESRYPVLRIWTANVGDAEPEIIHLQSGGDRLAVMQRELQLQFHRLNATEHGFLNSLSRGDTFAAAVDCGSTSDPDFDATAALQRFVSAGAIVGFRF
jgi:Putative DNA-binding domain